MNFCEFFYSGDQLLCHYKEFPSELTSLGKLFCSYSWAIKWLGLILGLNTWPVPSHPLKTGLVFERPNVCGLAANISTCRMRWKSNVVSGGCIDWSLLWCRRAVSQGLYSVCVICVLLLISRWCISWCWSLSDTSTQTIILWRNFTLIVLQACCKSNTFPPELADCLAPTLPIAWMWT